MAQKKLKLAYTVITLLLIVGAMTAAMLNIKTVVEYFSRASYEPANITVDTSRVLGPVERPWRNLAQGGEDKAWRMSTLRGPVAALHPEYIRLDHIYDFYDVASGSPGNVQFNFSKLDLVIDDILATGAKPYLALSYMPSSLAQGGELVGQPIRYEDWQLIVQRLIEHVSGTRGISDVYYEVWNEPDLFGGWKYYGDKNYITLYAYASNGARAARGVKPFKLGGPAITALYKNWFDALATAAIENNYKFDFFSWHRYSSDINVYRSDMAQVQSWVEKYPQLKDSLEFHITEWGHNSDVDAGYDGKYSAAHTVAAAIEMVGIVDNAFLFEIQDGKDPGGKEYWGRWGLFTHSSFGSKAKPRYQALRLLDGIGGDQLHLLGKGSFVKALASRRADGAYVLVLSNFDPSGANSEVVPVLLQNVAEGDYLVEINYLSKSKQQLLQTTTGTFLQFVVPIQPHDVAQVVITKR